MSIRKWLKKKKSNEVLGSIYDGLVSNLLDMKEALARRWGYREKKHGTLTDLGWRRMTNEDYKSLDTGRRGLDHD